ncbi:MAG: Transition state regulatory protein AbrB [Pelotomaculum sp. PtaU1.Bin035]|nr:MAG: Transition state regulatory protein AbrB [Pelotomaculum sp. PtaU1.Bin035]
MKSTGIVRKVDELGRVVIPIELRRTLGIDVNDSLEIYTDSEKIILKKYAPGCRFCNNVSNILEVGKIAICRNCAAELLRKLG